MEKYRNKIVELQREIAAHRETIARDLQGIGESVYADPPGALKRNPLLGDIADRIEQIDAANEHIRRIEEIVARLSDIDAQIQADKKRIRELMDGLDPVFEKVGILAFDIYKTHPFIDQEYVSIFSEMVTNQEEMREAERELEEIEAGLEKKPFLERMVLKGKLLLLKSRRSAREAAMPRLARRVGEQLCATTFVDMVDDATLSEAAAPCMETRAKVREIETEDTALADEAQTLGAELESLGAERRHGRRISELKKEIQTTEQGLRELYRRLGSAYRESLDGEAEEPERAKLLDSIAGTEATISERLDHIKRLEAALEVNRLGDEIARMEGSIGTLEERISRHQAEIASIRDRIAETDKAREAQIEIRGPEGSL